jgi:hypothetical protein
MCSRILEISSGSVLKAMIRIGSPHLLQQVRGIGFIDFSNPFCPAWRLLRIEIHRNSLHQDLLDPFFAVFALKFAAMTAGVIAP